MKRDLKRQISLSALVSIVIVALYHFISLPNPKKSEEPEYRGWRAGDYALITTRTSFRSKPDGSPLNQYDWCKIEAVSSEYLKVRCYYSTDDGDEKNDNMTNPRKMGDTGSFNIKFDKIRNINGWPSWGPRKPIW